MQWLSQKTGETIYLAIKEGLSVIYIDKIESFKPIRSWNPIGASAPLHCVGTGKAILAASYEKLREHIKDTLDKYTEKTITNIDKLDKDMMATDARGYAFDSGEYRERIFSFGAPIFLPNQEVIAAIGISLPDVNLPAEGEQVIGQLVLEASKRASAELGLYSSAANYGFSGFSMGPSTI